MTVVHAINGKNLQLLAFQDLWPGQFPFLYVCELNIKQLLQHLGLVKRRYHNTEMRLFITKSWAKITSGSGFP